jgi:hypothetical protein
MEFGLTMKTMRNFEFGPRAEWRGGEKEEEKLRESKKRKLDKEMGFMQYDPSYVGSDAGEFVRVQTKTRLNLLRAAKEAKGESVLDNAVLNLGNQVITTNLGYKKSKKRKNYYNKYSKPTVQVKTKFESTAQVKSEWKEVGKIDFPEMKKEEVKVEKEIISEKSFEERTFSSGFLKNRKKNFHKIRMKDSGFLPPHDIKNDPELMELYHNEEVGNDQLAVFLSENALYTLGAINISKFPFVLKASRKGNKILVWYDITPENCFLFWESYRESTSENYIENEKKIQKLSMESTQILEAFQVETINPCDRSFEKNKDLGKKEQEQKEEEAQKKEYKRRENSRIVKFTLNEKIIVYSRIGLEGKDAKGNEILVKALYDVRKLLNNKNKGDDVFLDCIQYNSYRITKWMVQAYLAGILYDFYISCYIWLILLTLTFNPLIK